MVTARAFLVKRIIHNSGSMRLPAIEGYRSSVLLGDLAAIDHHDVTGHKR